jgi:hypothetical protein
MHTLTIPAKSYVRKFLLSKGQLPVPLTLNTTAGIFLYHILRQQEHQTRYDDIVQRRYTEEIEIEISERYLFKAGVRNVTSFATVCINQFFENEMKKEFWEYISLRVNMLGMQQKTAIYSFMAEHMITEDDISYWGLKKKFKSTTDKMPKNKLFWNNGNEAEKVLRHLSPIKIAS